MTRRSCAPKGSNPRRILATLGVVSGEILGPEDSGLSEATRALGDAGFPEPWCVAVHRVFALGAYPQLLAAGVRGVVTCNTIAHPSNDIDVHDLIAQTAPRHLGQPTLARMD